MLDGRNVVVDTGRFLCLFGLKCFIDPVFGAIVDIRALFKGVVWSVHKAKSEFFVCFVTCAAIQLGITGGADAIEYFNITLRNL